MVNSFSYEEYLNIINNIKKTKRLKDFNCIDKYTSKFIVIRHDVEFSVERAYEMAKLEVNKCEINTSYFFQLRNNAYNILSKENIEFIREIYKMGHKIGLHVHLGCLEEIKKIKEYIIRDAETLQYYSKIPIDRFSFHRPSKELLYLNLEINGLINTYSDRYFHHFESEGNLLELCIKYFADSMHRWNYGYPSEENINRYDKIQLLIHPYSWTEKGYESYKNFKTLINEKEDTFIKTLENECKHFIR